MILRVPILFYIFNFKLLNVIFLNQKIFFFTDKSINLKNIYVSSYSGFAIKIQQFSFKYSFLRPFDKKYLKIYLHYNIVVWLAINVFY